MKRYIYIVIGVVVLAIIVVVGLFVWKNASSGAPAGQAGTGTTGTLPSTGTQGTNGGGTTNPDGTTTGNTGDNGSGSSGTGVTAGSFGPLSTTPVLNYYVSPSNVVLTIAPDGSISQIANGQTSGLSSSTVTNVISGAFSFDGKKALINFGDPNNPESSIFDIATKAWTGLPRGIQSPQWSPSDYRIAFVTSVATGTETLATIDASNVKKGSSALLTLHANNLLLQWANKTQFALTSKPSSLAPGSSLLFDSQKHSITPLITEANGLETLLAGVTTSSPSIGLVYFVGDSGRGGLRLVDLSGASLENLSIATLPPKCGFGTATPTSASTTPYLALYCGVPRDASAFLSAQLPDDYEQLALFTSDSIQRINTKTGALEMIWNDASQNIDVSNVKALGSSLFFINRYNNELYTLTIQN